MWARFVVGWILLVAAPHDLFGQVVHGELIEQGTGVPIGGAVVVLVDEGGTQHHGVLTDPSGRFELRAPAPGRYRLVGERIGYGNAPSAFFDLQAGETREERLLAPVEAISLEGVSVGGQRRCMVDPRQGLQIATVWEEARKALRATSLTEEQAVARLSVLRYERDLDGETGRVERETVRQHTTGTTRPFVSTPIAELAEHGWIRDDGDGRVFHGPDAQLLLSDLFLNTHCFRLQGGEDGLIGLAFEPVAGRRLPDIRGVLWLERRTAELRHVEYRYTGLDIGVRADEVGGRMEFERIPGAGWIVDRWWIRMPRIAVERRQFRRERRTLLGYKEEGGEVAAMVLSSGDAHQSPRAELTGVVFDSIGGVPLAGATVYLSGTGYAATSDERGVYRMQGLPEGEYGLTFHHPRLDTLGWRPAPRAVMLRRGEETIARLAIPTEPAP